MPSMSQIGDFMVVSAPCGSFFRCCSSCFDFTNGGRTLAHQGRSSQAGLPGPVLRGDAGNRTELRIFTAHSARQNMQPGTPVLSLALWRAAGNAVSQIDNNFKGA